jgi:TolA-binding protein
MINRYLVSIQFLSSGGSAMTSDRDPTFEGKQTEQGSTFSPARVELHASRRAQPETHSGGSLGTILTSCVLSLIMGGAGAWAYVDYLGPMLGKKPAEKALLDAQKSESSATDTTARMSDLSGKLDELRSRVDKLPKALTAQDLNPLKERLALLDELSRKVDAVGQRVNSLPGKIDQDSRNITTLTADLAGMRNEVASLRNNIHASAEKPSTRAVKPSDDSEKPRTPSTSEPPREISPPVSSLLQSGIESYQKKQYSDASTVFAGLVKTQPDDARIWYYAALSRGFATGDWKGETERLVTQGVEREKAGKPTKTQIDAAFADLTTATGKDWLAFYRRRAG